MLHSLITPNLLSCRSFIAVRRVRNCNTDLLIDCDLLGNNAHSHKSVPPTLVVGKVQTSSNLRVAIHDASSPRRSFGDASPKANRYWTDGHAATAELNARVRPPFIGNHTHTPESIRTPSPNCPDRNSNPVRLSRLFHHVFATIMEIVCRHFGTVNDPDGNCRERKIDLRMRILGLGSGTTRAKGLCL